MYGLHEIVVKCSEVKHLKTIKCYKYKKQRNTPNWALLRIRVE